VRPVRKRNFTTATKQQVTRETGYAIISAEGFETVDEVVFAEPSDMALLGVRTLDGFGVMVDNVAHRFVATTTIVAKAFSAKAPPSFPAVYPKHWRSFVPELVPYAASHLCIGYFGFFGTAG
jgi:hypothetical protein